MSYISIKVPVTKMFVAVAMLAVPEFLNSSVSQMAGGEGISSIIEMIRLISYLVGVGMGFSAALSFKEYSEQSLSYNNNETTEKKIEVAPLIIEKEKEEPIPVILEKEEIKVPTPIIFKKIEGNNLDFKDKELNDLVKQIQEKVSYLKEHNFIKKDMASQLMVEKTETEYLKKIHLYYMDMPDFIRGKKGAKDTPYDLTFNQLSLLLQGLEEIENKIVRDGIMNQKANELFLKEKVANI